MTRSAVTACCRSSGPFLVKSGVTRPTGAEPSPPKGRDSVATRGQGAGMTRLATPAGAVQVGADRGRGSGTVARAPQPGSVQTLDPDGALRDGLASAPPPPPSHSTFCTTPSCSSSMTKTRAPPRVGSSATPLAPGPSHRGCTTRRSGSPLRYCAEHWMTGRRARRALPAPRHMTDRVSAACTAADHGQSRGPDGPPQNCGRGRS